MMKLVAFLLTLPLLSSVGTLAQPVRTGNMPNIVIVLADDLGQGDIGAFNAASKLRTPNLNKLAREGMAFQDAHSGSGVCTPTRYGLLTGRYAFRSKLKRGVLQGYSTPLIDPGQATIASVAKQAGYATACIGKWHLGLNWQKQDPAKALFEGDAQSPTSANADYTKPVDGIRQLGFDYSFVLPASLDMPPYCLIKNGRVVNPNMQTIQGHDMQEREVFYRTGDLSTGMTMPQFLPAFINEANAFIERHSRSPFLLYLPLSAPHTPWAIEEKFRGSSTIGTYGDFVQQTDYYIGQVLATLEKNGLSRNTIVIFASDNGSYWTEADIKASGHQSNNNLRGMKADIFDGGHRIPMLVRWPGNVPANVINQTTVCLTDLLATVADVTRQPIPSATAEDSYSLLPLFDQKKAARYKRPFTIHHSGDGKFAIRKGDWKYVSSLGSGGFSKPKNIVAKTGEATGQLYNMKTDPSEQTNLFLEKPKVVAEMAKALAVFEEIGKP